jgi:hypothetical protein
MNCQTVISDMILQAARGAVPSDAERLMLLPDCGARNKPLMPLLVGLVEALQVTAKAVMDNAWDEHHPLEFGLSAELAGQCRAIASDLMNAAAASPEGWSLPSMTGKELV